MTIAFHPENKRPIEKVFDCADGAKLYRFVAMEDYSPARVVWLTEYLRYLALGADQNTYSQFSEALKRAIDAQDWDEVRRVRWMMDEIFLRATIVETYYDIASVLFFYLDEDVHQHDLYAAKAKKTALKALEPGFFFTTLKLQKVLSLTFPSDIHAYLARNEAKVKAILMSLSRFA
jgi:hypothetical protein